MNGAFEDKKKWTVRVGKDVKETGRKLGAIVTFVLFFDRNLSLFSTGILVKKYKLH